MKQEPSFLIHKRINEERELVYYENERYRYHLNDFHLRLLGDFKGEYRELVINFIDPAMLGRNSNYTKIYIFFRKYMDFVLYSRKIKPSYHQQFIVSYFHQKEKYYALKKSEEFSLSVPTINEWIYKYKRLDRVNIRIDHFLQRFEIEDKACSQLKLIIYEFFFLKKYHPGYFNKINKYLWIIHEYEIHRIYYNVKQEDAISFLADQYNFSSRNIKEILKRFRSDSLKTKLPKYPALPYEELIIGNSEY